MSDLYEYIGNKIRELRMNYGGSGLRQEELAAKLKISTNTISRWETAKYKPSIKDLDKLSRFFGVSISTFFPKNDGGSRIQALLSATGDLKEDDIDDLIEYAIFRKARREIEKNKRGKS